MTVALRAIGPTEKDKYLAFRTQERRRRRETITKVSTENKRGTPALFIYSFLGVIFRRFGIESLFRSSRLREPCVTVRNLLGRPCRRSRRTGTPTWTPGGIGFWNRFCRRLLRFCFPLGLLGVTLFFFVGFLMRKLLPRGLSFWRLCLPGRGCCWANDLFTSHRCDRSDIKST